MRRILLTMLMAIVATTLSLKAQTIVIDEGFENGIQDSLWTQEFVVGNTPWAVESVDDNLDYPKSVWQGTKRAYLRNTTGETQGYVTRLVSKVMDLSPEKVYQPELTFWYANPKWTADRDTLRVLYRTGPKAKWKQLAEFSTASANWQKVHLMELPELSETYQIAFEGTDNLGRGIVLDSVKLRSAPQCTTPHDIAINSLGAGKVNISWVASWDASRYEMIITKDEKISPDTIFNVADSVIALQTSVEGLFQNIDVQLESGAYYYVYLRSMCDFETSQWNHEDPAQSGHFRFRVKATKNIPYSYGFDMPYEPGTLRRDLEWTWGNNMGNFNPFINVAVTLENRAKYSKSGTSCVVFSGANVSEPAASNALPANRYAYVATPALADTSNADFALNQCLVRFWSTVVGFQGRSYAHSLIVGVMTDPEDITTFVPVDTVSVWGTSTFQENVVDLSSYDGEGVYVGFMSAFETQNIFFLDDITIEYKTSIQKPSAISVNPRDTYADITWKGNSPSYNVLITNAEVDPSKATSEQIVDRAEGVIGNSYKTENLEADHSWNRPYYVYVQGVDGENKSEWSYRYPFVTIATKRALPYSFDFEQKSGIYNIGEDATMYPMNVGIFSNDPEYPHIVTSNAHDGSTCLNLTKDWGNDSWITLPMVDDSLKNIQVKFYLSGSSTPAQAFATVGVMTNPMDINTFIPVGECKVALSSYSLCYANFQNYDGPEGVIAIVWSDVDGKKQTINYIDDLTVEEVQKCLPPVNIQTEATSDAVIVSWDASDATTWELILADSTLTEKQLKQSIDSISNMEHVLFADTLEWDDILNDPSFTFDSLNYNTNHYIWVRTLCGEDKTWWLQSSFTTLCPDKFPIPFREDFDSYASVNQVAGCWVLRNQTASSAYPKVMSLTVSGVSQKVLELYSASTTTRSWAVMPGTIDDFSSLMLSFDVRTWGSATTSKAVLYVGSMGDVEDQNTFVAVDTIYLYGSSDYTRINMDLANYNFAYNNIAFTSGLAETMELTTSDVALDNILLKPNTCIEAWNFESTDIQTNSIDIKWEGKAENDEWIIRVMQDTTVVIPDSTIYGKAFHAENLEPTKLYTFYVQASCDSTWSSASFRTACIKLDPSKPNKETFESYASGSGNVPSCWTVGNGYGSGAGTGNIPYVYSSTSYASSGTMVLRINETTTQNPAYAASPEIMCDKMSDLAVSFTFYASTSYWGVFGVMSDPEDLSTFVALDSLKGTAAKVSVSLDLSDYTDSIPATAKYFAWRGRYSAADLFYIDDVSIIKITCPLTKPSYSELTAESVRISSGLRNNNGEWELLLTDSLISVDSLAVEGFEIPAQYIAHHDTINKRNKLVEDLNEKTTYYGYTRSLCDGGEASQWAQFSFTTPCLAVTPEGMGTITFSKEEGYETGSGKILPCWTTSNKTNTSSTSYIPYIGTTASYKHNGNNYLYVYSYVTSSTSYDGAYAIMPQLNVDDISKYQVNFWARTTSSTTAAYHDNLIIGVITDPSDLNTFTVIDTLTLSHTAYEPFSVSLEDYQGDYLGQQGKYIMFMTETGVSGATAYGYAYISEISVEAIPTCRPVTEFTVDSIAEDVAVVSWKQYSDSYRMLIADKAVAEKDKATYEWLLDSTVTSTSHVKIEGLKPATQYYVYAQALCEGGDSSAISMTYANILTECPVVNGYPVPYYNDFDDSPATGTGKKPLCWDGVQLTYDTVGTTQSYPYVNATASYAVSKYSMYMYSYFASSSNSKTIAVAPKVAGNLNEYMVSFYARKGGTTTSYGGKLLVGYVTDATQHGMDSTFVTIATVEVTTATQQPYQVIISDYTNSIPAGARIALKADHSIQGLTGTSGYASFYIDNFKIGMPPSCYPPTLEAGNTSLTTADIHITPAKEGNDHWELAVVPDSIYSKTGYDATTYLAGKEVRIVDADSANFVVSGLTEGTKYWVYARTVCGGEDGNSAWTDMAIPTRTKYYYKDSYFFGFEQEEGWERSPLSTSDSYIIHPALEAGYVQLGSAITSYSYLPLAYITTSSGYNYGYGPSDWSMGKTGIRWNATTSYYGQYVIMPALDEAKDRSFEFKFRNGYSYISSGKYIITSTANVSIEIGTVDKFKGMETYQKLATVSMNSWPSNTEATEANDWLWDSYTLDLDSATIADKQIVFYQAQKPTASGYPYIDNVKMDAPKGFGMVSLGKIQAEAHQATVTWDNIGGPWSLYILKANGDTLKRYENIAGVTSQEVTGLSPQSKYTAALVATNAPKDTKYKISDSKVFYTPCLPVDPDENGEFVWDFNDDYEQSNILPGTTNDALFLKPACFTVGTTYSPTTTAAPYTWMIQRKGYAYTSTPTKSTSYDHYEVGRGDSPALRIFSSSSTYASATVHEYIVLPELNCSFDTMMIEFWGRCFINYDDTHGTASYRNKMVSATYLGTSYSQSIVVGTLTDPSDFNTLEVIDTVTYNAYTSTTADLVTKDPTGNRYWQKFQLPLSSAKGKYLVLYQPKHGLFIMDDLKVTAVGDNLFAPGGATTSNVTTNSATFSWTVKHPGIQSVVVVTDQEGKNEILRDTVEGTITTFTVDTLKPATAYQWYMYQTNGTVETSTTPYLAFYTECVAVDPNYSTGFELVDGWKLVSGATSDTYKQTMCWTYGNAGTTTAWSSSFPYNYANTTSYVYSYAGVYAPRLYAYSTTYQTYIAMPAVEDAAALDTMQVNFMMRPGYHVPSTGKINTTYAYYSSSDYYYSKAVIVGTMTDPHDAKTFVPIDTINYNGTFTTSDYATAVNDYLFEKKKVVLTGATGKYVAFMATLWAKGAENKSTYDYMWIDNVSITPIQHCEAPVELTTSKISATSATLSWEAPEGAASYLLQVSTDPTFAADTAFAYNDTVYSESFVLTGLKSYTDYIWRIKTICGNDLGESDFTQNSGFTTARQPFFVETFGATNLDPDWSMGTNPYLLVLDSTDVEITGSSSNYGFHRVTTDFGIKGAHYCAPFYSSSTATSTTYDYYWLITPVICLDDVKTAHLTWDMALTGASTTTPNGNVVTEANMADDFIFAAAISEDGGKTWKTENVLDIWCNALPAGIGHHVRDIPYSATTVRYDLAKYVGKNIRVAFYREAQTYLANTCAVHLDNIRINYYDHISGNAEACQYEDVEELGFFIDGDKAAAGDSTYIRLEYAYNFDANTKGYRDSLYTLDVIYTEAPETVYADTICEGETFSDMNFTDKTRSGVYRHKMQSALHCDSIVTLHLFVAPKQETTEFDTICFGTSIVWHGKTYDRSGLYNDTLQTMYGCDSIVYFNLTVRDQITGVEKRTICYGGKYIWNGEEYTAAGKYNKTLTSVTGCDSIATLELEVSDIIFADPQQETICHGTTYTWNGKVYDKAGTYRDTIQSVYGCDSVNTLILTIAPMIQGAPLEQTICYGSSYTWNGKTYASAGTYKDTLVTAAGCDSIATLVIKVTDILIGVPQKHGICEGATYTWNGKVYDKAGTYKDTITSVAGCDSVATLELSVSSLIHGEPQNVSICQGESFAWNSKVYTNPGTYTDTLTASYGCDSIATLVLTWFGIEDTIRVETEVALAELPFTYQNAEHPYATGQAPITYPVGTEVGVYYDTVLVVGKNCTAVLVHTLNLVAEHQGIDNIGDSNFGLKPNVIRAGETVTAYGDFTGTVHIQVYDVVGRLITDERNDAKSSITINAFPQSGVYTVRISDSNATQYVGRVLVK